MDHNINKYIFKVLQWVIDLGHNRNISIKSLNILYLKCIDILKDKCLIIGEQIKYFKMIVNYLPELVNREITIKEGYFNCVNNIDSNNYIIDDTDRVDLTDEELNDICYKFNSLVKYEDIFHNYVGKDNSNFKYNNEKTNNMVRNYIRRNLYRRH